MFSSIARDRFDKVSFELLGPKMGKRFWKCIIESVSEHDNELELLAGAPMTLVRERSRRSNCNRALAPPARKTSRARLDIQQYEDCRQEHIRVVVKAIVYVAAARAPWAASQKVWGRTSGCPPSLTSGALDRLEHRVRHLTEQATRKTTTRDRRNRHPQTCCKIVVVVMESEMWGG